MSFERMATKERQEQIAQAALDLVASDGLTALSMAALARRVGLVPSAIYRHFKNKDEVLDASLRLVRQRILEEIATVRECSADALERLRLLITRHVEAIRHQIAIPRIIHSEDFHSDRPRRTKEVRELMESYLREVSAIVREGQEQKTIRTDAPSDTIALMFIGLLQPMSTLWDLTKGECDITKHLEHAWRIFSETISLAKS